MKVEAIEMRDGLSVTEFRLYEFHNTVEFGLAVRLLLALGARFKIQGETIIINPAPQLDGVRA